MRQDDIIPLIIIAFLVYKLGVWISSKARSFIAKGIIVGGSGYLFYGFYLSSDAVIGNLFFYLFIGALKPHIAYYINLAFVSMDIMVNWYYIGITVFYKIVRFFKWLFSRFNKQNRSREDNSSQEEKHDYNKERYEEAKRQYERQSGNAHQQGQGAYQKSYHEKQQHQETEHGQYRPEHARFFSESHYSILGVEVDSTFREIKKAYRALIREYHPDLNPENEKEYTAIVQRINGAFEYFEKKNKIEPF